MIAPYKVKYNKIFSNELNVLDLIMDVAFDSDNGESTSFLNRSAVQSESYDGRYKNTVRYKYDEVFAPKFTFLKKNFEEFSIDEVRQVLKYLTHTDTPSLLEVYYDDTNVVAWAAIGGWTEIQLYKLANNTTVGITAVFSSIMPYAMSGLYIVTKAISSAEDNQFIIEIDTDDNQPVYPRITIQQTGTVVEIPKNITMNVYDDMVPNTVYYNGTTYYWKSDESSLITGEAEPSYGWTKVIRDNIYTESDEIKEETIYYYTSDQKYRWIDHYTFKSSSIDPKLATTGVKVINKHYDLFNQPSSPEIMVVKNNTSTERVVIDGANQVISSTNTRRIFGDDFEGWNWLPLYDGRNEITVEGNCEITLEYRTVIKCGEY